MSSVSRRALIGTVVGCLFTAIGAGSSVAATAHSGTSSAATAHAVQTPASGSHSSAWLTNVSAASLVKDNLDAQDYEYPLIGGGGLDLLADPTGLTSVTPPNADYSPDLYYDYWWNNNTSRVTPFTLDSGYVGSQGIAPETIQSFKQTLDPATEHLTSVLQLQVCPGGGQPCYDVQSTRTEYVTPSGILAIRIVDSVPGRIGIRTQAQTGYTLAPAAHENGIAFTAQAPNQHDMALAVTAGGSRVSSDAGSGTVSVAVGPHSPAVFYIAARGLDSQRPAADAFAAASKAARAGETAAERATGNFWTRYWNASSVDVPDADLMTWYIRSEYYLGALTSNTPVPVGCYGPRPDGYNGGPCLEYDLIFTDLALLDANQPATTSSIANWIEKTLPEAERLAPSYTYNGAPAPGAAKYPWISSWNGDETTDFGTTPVANDWEGFPSANAALVDLLQAQYTGDGPRLQKAKHILQEVTQYLLDNAAPDPSVGGMLLSQQYFWTPDPVTFVKGAAPDQTALLWALRESRDLHVGPAQWAQLANDVYLPTGLSPYRANQPAVINYPGQQAGYVGFPEQLPFFFLNVVSPQDPLTWPSYMNSASTDDMTYTYNRAWAATVAAEAGNGDDALARLDYMIDANSDSVDPSQTVLFDNTYFSEFQGSSSADVPEVGAHATLMLATQHMLFDGSSADTIKVFPALPDAWEQSGASFRHLAATGQLLVSGDYRRSKVTATVTNEGNRTATRELLIRMPADAVGVSDEQGLPITGIVDGNLAQVRVTVPPRASRTVTLLPSSTGTWQTVDDTSSQISYSGQWGSGTGLTGFVDGTAHYSATCTSTAQLTFDGQAVRIVGDRDVNHGQMRVYIDGQLQGDYDTWALKDSQQDVLFQANGLAPGPHTVQLIVGCPAVGGTPPLADQYSSGNDVTLDAIEYLATSNQLTQTDDGDSSVSYQGQWTAQTAAAGTFDGTAHTASTAGASVSHDFTGNGITVLGAKGPDGGLVDVYLDGELQTRVDTYGFSAQPSTVLWKSNALRPGPHRVQLVVVGASNPSSTATNVTLDAFDVSSG